MAERSSGGRRFFRKKKYCKLCSGEIKEKEITYKNVDILKSFITERGKISSRTRSGLCAKHQRLIAGEVKRSRMIALLPFKVEYYRSSRKS